LLLAVFELVLFTIVLLDLPVQYCAFMPFRRCISL